MMTLLKTGLDVWHARVVKRQTYSVVRRLNDHQLRDIGLSRLDMLNFAVFKNRAVAQKNNKPVQRSHISEHSSEQTNPTGSAKGMLLNNSWPEKTLTGDGNA